MSLPILTEIEDGQPYVDEPIYSYPRRSINAIRRSLGFVEYEKILTRYNHVKLRWMKPSNDGLIPR